MSPLKRYLLLILVFSLIEFAVLGFLNSEYALKISMLIYMWTPALAALLTLGKRFKELKASLLVRSPRGLLAIALGLFIPLVHLALTRSIFSKLWIEPSVVLYILKGREVSLTQLISLGLIAGATVNAIAALGEEIGWRWFLYNELRSWGKLRASVAIGATWALWHWPLLFYGYNFPQSRVLGLLPFALTLIPLTYVMLFLVDLGGVFPSAVLHGTVNALLPLEYIALSSLPDWLRPPAGIGGAIGWTIIGIATYLLANRASLSKWKRLERS